MVVQKRGKRDTKHNSKLYAKKHIRTLSVTAAVRDRILPHRYVEVEVTPDGCVVFTPTDRESAYKLTISSCGQAKMSWSYTDHIVPLRDGVEIPIIELDDGRLKMLTQGVATKHG